MYDIPNWNGWECESQLQERWVDIVSDSVCIVEVDIHELERESVESIPVNVRISQV